MSVYDEVVTDPQVIARLPHAGPTKVEWQWLVFRWTWRAVELRDWWSVRYYWGGIRRTRYANCESVSYGPVSVHRARPWLLWPAQSLHPEAFTTESTHDHT